MNTRLKNRPGRVAATVPATLLTIAFLSGICMAQQASGMTVLSPVGGEIFSIGDSMTIQWQLDSGVYISDAVVIEISVDGGLTYTIVGGSIRRGTDEFKARRVRWLIPPSLLDAGTQSEINLRSDNCLLYLHGYSNYTIYAYTSRSFAIRDAASARRSPAAHAPAVGRHGAVLLAAGGAGPAAWKSPSERLAGVMVDGRIPGVGPSRLTAQGRYVGISPLSIRTPN